MNISRRFFIGGAASFGAFQGCRLAQGPSLGGVARLKFGVVSDIHVIAENTDRPHQGNTRTFRRALRWFDAQGVDGVIIAGDMADAGLVSQLQCVADAWNAVFPGNRSRLDGRPVEKLFVYGNHDWEGYNYGYSIFGKPSGELTPDKIRTVGLKKAWEEVFEEEYAPVYRKVVKGYSFVGGHWDGDNGSAWGAGPDIAPFFAAHGKEIDPSLPFFYFQHPHPKDTCYGSWAWGHDAGVTTKVLSAYPNAIAFSGHSHYSLTDERSIWQGAFTSLGTGSLRYSCVAENEFADQGGLENGKGAANNRKGSAERLMPNVDVGEERNGMLFSVYDDHISITRRDFMCDMDLGPDWVMPLPAAESKPFAFAAHAKTFPALAFAADAKIKVERAKRKVGKKEAEVFNLTVPSAAQTFSNRVFRYDVRIETKDGKAVLTRHLMAPGFHLPFEKSNRPFVLPVPVSDVPQDAEFRFAVVPVNSFGHGGAPLTTEYLKAASASEAEKKA